MDQKFFRVPFASVGDRQTIPDVAPTNGSVSYPSGWGADYAKDPGADASAKPVEREAMNTVLNAITGAIRQYQTNGYPEWITTANNNGAAFGYDAGVVVDYNGVMYLSLVSNNTATPGADATKWQLYIQREATEQEALAGDGSAQVMTPRRVKQLADYLDDQLHQTITTAMAPYILPVGAIILWGNTTPPEGWLELNGQTFDTAENPELAALYPSGRVPDWRGNFVRAWAHGSSVDPDSNRAILSFQSDAFREHYHYSRWLGFDNVGSLNGLGDAGGPGGFRYAGGDDPNWHNSPNADLLTGGDETRPKNVAAMYIIKTDKAESEAGAETPSAIVISPASVTMNAGTTRQFTGTILPSALAAGYPVSWSVSDPSLGSINSSGLYTATAGKSGTQTLIASISTGLTATATVTQQLYLTSIDIGPVPAGLLAGNSYPLTINYSPANYTETVNSASTDASVATLSADGTLTVSGAGTATLSLTGASSGVTDSITITATEEVIQETRLLIANNLSEIAASGGEAQSDARENLGLGALATKDALTAADTGAVPQDTQSLGTADLNAVVSPGRKFQSLTGNATTERHYPVSLAGMLDVIRTTETGIRQIYYPYNTTDVHHRYCEDTAVATPVFSNWSLNGAGDYLEAENNLSDVADVATARQNIGVSYTLSTDAAPADASGYAAGHIWYQVEES